MYYGNIFINNFKNIYPRYNLKTFKFPNVLKAA